MTVHPANPFHPVNRGLLIFSQSLAFPNFVPIIVGFLFTNCLNNKKAIIEGIFSLSWSRTSQAHNQPISPLAPMMGLGLCSPQKSEASGGALGKWRRGFS